MTRSKSSNSSRRAPKKNGKPRKPNIVVEQNTVDTMDIVSNNPSLSCVCGKSKDGCTLICSKCYRLIHWICSGLPLYQLSVFVQTRRTYICENCAAQYVSENITTELGKQQNQAQSTTGSPKIGKVISDSDQLNIDLTDSSNKDTGIHQTGNNTDSTIVKTVKEILYIQRTHENQLKQIMNAISEHHPIKEKLRADMAVQTEDSATVLEVSPSAPSSVMTYADAVRTERSVLTSVEPIDFEEKGKEKPSRPTDSQCKHRDEKLPVTRETKPVSQKGKKTCTVETRSNETNKNNANQKRKKFSQNKQIPNILDADQSQVPDDLPNAMIFHDSVLNKIDGKRLGLSYGFSATMTKTSTIKDCKNAILKHADDRPTPDAIVLHVGINDLKTKEPEESSGDMVSCIDLILEKFPKAHVVLSKVCPTKRSDLHAKSELFNAQNFSKLYNKERVSFQSHNNLNVNNKGLLKDDIHPSGRGTSILAGNLGRHLEVLFWKKPTNKSTNRRKLQTGGRPIVKPGHQHPPAQIRLHGPPSRQSQAVRYGGRHLADNYWDTSVWQPGSFHRDRHHWRYLQSGGHPHSNYDQWFSPRQYRDYF